MNNLGDVVGTNLAGHAFVYSHGTMTDLGALAGGTSSATGINDQGTIVGAGSVAGGAYHAFVFSNGGITDIGTLGGPNSAALAINNSGEIVGWSITPGGTYPLGYVAFSYYNGTMTNLGELNGGEATAVAINSSGKIAGSSQVSFGSLNQGLFNAFVYTDGAMTDITPSIGYGFANGINDAGVIVGRMGGQTFQYQAFIFENGVATTLTTFGTYENSEAYGINNSGVVVGSVSGIAFVFSDGQMWDLNTLIDDPSVQLSAALCVNNVGQIVAGDGNGTAYLLTPNPPLVTTPTISTEPAAATVAFGASTTLSIVVASSGQTPNYQWELDGVPIAGATFATYVTSVPGRYSVVVTNSGGSVTSNTVTVSAATRLANISSRAQVGSGADVEIAGFVVAGSPGSTEQVLVRGVGPSLSQFGITDALANPMLTVFDSYGNIVAENSSWGSNSDSLQISSAASAVGAFPLPLGSADCAVLASLVPGSYTAEVSGIGGTTGVALAEVYEINYGVPEIINISARAHVGINSDEEIAGFVVSGSQSAKVLVRAIGPSLGQFGVNDFLAIPSLNVVDSSGVTVASNTGWLTNPDAAMVVTESALVGAFALSTEYADSALLLTLPPGSYTAVVSGAEGTSGVALVEVYQAP